MIIFFSLVFTAIKFNIQPIPYRNKNLSYEEYLEDKDINATIIIINDNNNIQYANYLKRADIKKIGILIGLIDGTLFQNGYYKSNEYLKNKPDQILAGKFDRLDFLCS